jgi:hypothetical protein
LRIPDEADDKAAMKRVQVCDWRKRFHDGLVSVEDDPRCGRKKK